MGTKAAICYQIPLIGLGVISTSDMASGVISTSHSVIKFSLASLVLASTASPPYGTRKPVHVDPSRLATFSRVSSFGIKVGFPPPVYKNKIDD